MDRGGYGAAPCSQWALSMLADLGSGAEPEWGVGTQLSWAQTQAWNTQTSDLERASLQSSLELCYTQAVGLYFTSDDGTDACEKMSEYVKGGNPESHVDDVCVGVSPSCSRRHAGPCEIQFRMNCAFFFLSKSSISSNEVNISKKRIQKCVYYANDITNFLFPSKLNTIYLHLKAFLFWWYCLL